MSIEIKPGTRLRSAVCAVEVIVIKSGRTDADIRCGGEPMIGLDDERPTAANGSAQIGSGTLLGKRYTDEELGIELLCTKAGPSSLSVADVPMQLKDAKPLPSSD